MTKYIDFWKNTFNFSGYSSVSEFWIPVFFNAFIAITLLLINPLFFKIFDIILFVPLLSCSIRRLRDGDSPTFFIILAFIPFANFYWIYLMIKD